MTYEAPASFSIGAETSPVKAPLGSVWQSWAPRASVPPLSFQAAWASSVAGGQTASSARPASPASAARRIASISTSDAERPFIFQLPATNGRTSGVMTGYSGISVDVVIIAGKPMQTIRRGLEGALQSAREKGEGPECSHR